MLKTVIKFILTSETKKHSGLCLILLFCLCGSITAQTTAFTYQGKLNDAGSPAGGNYDFVFKLFSVANGGSQIGVDVARNDVLVANGIFTVSLDFGSSPFASTTGNYLEISVRAGASTGGHTMLAPRQMINNAPYSIKSLNADNAVNAVNATNATNATTAATATNAVNATNATTAQNALQLGGTAANQFVLTNDTRLSDSRNPLPNSPSYVQNTTSPQSSSNFNVSGNGTVGGTLNGNVLNATTQFNQNGSRLLAVTTGQFPNLYLGPFAGAAITSGDINTFVGVNAGQNTTSGQQNSFFGFAAGQNNTTGAFNAFFGGGAGGNNLNGTRNAFFGYTAGRLNTTGAQNSFFGASAGFQNTTGINNSFFGDAAGFNNSTGVNNSFLGRGTGDSNTVEDANSFIGAFSNGAAGITNATALGYQAQVTQSNSLVLGSIAGNTKVGIGTTAPVFKLEVVDASNLGLRVQTNIAGGTVASFGGAGAFNIDASGSVGGRFTVKENGNVGLGVQAPTSRLDVGGIITIRVLGTAGSTSLCLNPSSQIASCSSSIRYKENVNNFPSGLNLIRRLRPVSFNWKQGAMADLGLIAEEVAEAEPLLATYTDKGEIQGVKYDRVGVVLVNAVKEQQAQIEDQQKQLDEQNQLIGLQKEKLATAEKQLQRQKSEFAALKALVCSQNPTAEICQSREE